MGVASGSDDGSSGSIDPTDTGSADGSTSIDSSGGGSADAEGGDGSCTDGFRNGNESDVDCGGPNCPQCEPGQDCTEPADCTTGVCENGECQAATCYDDVLNGNEDDVDCGGSCPNGCLPPPAPCEEDFECESDEFCLDGECTPSACDNDIQDSSETDVDCGGVDCPECADGLMCVIEEDCESGVCEGGICLAPTCMDMVQNQDESDADCGGSVCPPCPNGSDCMMDSDCTSGICDSGTCTAGSCMDNVQNQDETDIDCGGVVCEPCMDDAECTMDSDCESGVCDETAGTCAAPTCTDNVQNDDETDIDCGNSCGMNTCEVGEGCDDDTDCVEEVCEFTVCSAPDCFDGVANGLETDTDCGVAAGCGPCDDNEGCDSDADCVSGICNLATNTCSPPACDDGLQNGDETDTDCGNMCGPTCIPGESCDDALDCTTGVCTNLLCQAASCSDGVLNGDEVDTDCSGSCPQPCEIDPEGTVNTTTTDFQTSPSLAVAPDGSFWVVTWTSSPLAGAAQDGSGAGIFGQMFDDLGPLGGEFQINTTTNGNQQFSDVAAYNDGFVVLWQSDSDQDGDGTGVYGQRFNDSGTAQGGEFLVNETTADAQRRPSVAMDNAGNFVACWDSNAVDFDVYCRRYSQAGAALSGEVLINAVNTVNDQLPVVSRESNGAYTVVWQTGGATDGSGLGVYMRRFNSGGTQVTATTQVNTTTAGNQSEPTVAIDGSGNFVVAWTSESLDGSATGIAARRYNSGGTAQGGEFVVNTTTAGAQQRPAIGMANDGDFWIAWQTPNDGDTTGIFGRRYQANGTGIGVQFLVNPTITDHQQDPEAGVRLDTEIIGVWSHGDAGFTTSDIEMVRYDGEL